jgi:cellulose biosynthesis protein BcsQ
MKSNTKSGSLLKEKKLKTACCDVFAQDGPETAPAVFAIKNSRTVVFSSITGGSGCSFIVNTISAYFAKNKNLNVLLLDMQAGKKDSRMIFNITGDFIRDQGDITCNFSEIDAAILKKLVINLDSSLNIILPSLKFEKIIIQESNRVEKLLCVLSNYYDLVLVDLPFYHFFNMQESLSDRIDKFVFISQADYISVINLENFISNFSCESASLKLELLVNKFNLKTVISPARIMNTLRFPVKTFIPYDRDIEYLYLAKGPFAVFDYCLRTVKALRDFADAMYEEIYM